MKRNNKKVYYTIEKSRFNNMWILWKNTEGKNTCGCYKMYQDISKAKVKTYLRKYKEELKCWS